VSLTQDGEATDSDVFRRAADDKAAVAQQGAVFRRRVGG